MIHGFRQWPDGRIEIPPPGIISLVPFGSIFRPESQDGAMGEKSKIVGRINLD
jgi:hypothetical protein